MYQVDITFFRGKSTQSVDGDRIATIFNPQGIVLPFNESCPRRSALAWARREGKSYSMPNVDGLDEGEQYQIVFT